MTLELGHDLVKRANARSGWQLSFSQHFMVWLHFEKSFLFPTLSEGRKLTRIVMTTLMTTVRPLSFVNSKNRNRFDATLMQYWKQTCASRYFEVFAAKDRGFYVVSKTNKYKLLQKALVGHCVYLNQRHHFMLHSVNYNSLFKCNDGSSCILYGPLQFANHSCSSHLKIKLRHNKTFHFIHEYDEEFDLNELVIKNQEVLLCYVRKEELWFACKCVECA